MKMVMLQLTQQKESRIITSRCISTTEKFTQLRHEDMENKLISMTDTESVLQILPTKHCTGPGGLTAEFYQTLKKNH